MQRDQRHHTSEPRLWISHHTKTRRKKTRTRKEPSPLTMLLSSRPICGPWYRLRFAGDSRQRERAAVSISRAERRSRPGAVPGIPAHAHNQLFRLCTRAVAPVAYRVPYRAGTALCFRSLICPLRHNPEISRTAQRSSTRVAELLLLASRRAPFGNLVKATVRSWHACLVRTQEAAKHLPHMKFARQDGMMFQLHR